MSKGMAMVPPSRRRVLGLGLVFAVAALTLIGVFRAAEWYAGTVLLPRYCGDPDGAALTAARIVEAPRPRGSMSRAEIIAAKLRFILPRNIDEAPRDYAVRLSEDIRARCR